MSPVIFLPCARSHHRWGSVCFTAATARFVISEPRSQLRHIGLVLLLRKLDNGENKNKGYKGFAHNYIYHWSVKMKSTQ